MFVSVDWHIGLIHHFYVYSNLNFMLPSKKLVTSVKKVQMTAVN
jgi:hypothetical protein